MCWCICARAQRGCEGDEMVTMVFYGVLIGVMLLALVLSYID